MNKKRLHIKFKNKSFVFLVLFLIVLTDFSYSQKNREFDSVYSQAATVYIFSNPEKALKIADSLYQISSTKRQEIRSLMLKAGVYLGKPDLKKAVDIALEADKIAVKSKDYEWEFRTKGFIASIYQKLHFTEKGLAILDEMDLLLPKIKDSLNKINLTVLNLQSRANSHGLRNEQDSVICYLDKGEKHYKTLEKLREGRYMIAFSEIQRAWAFYETNQWNKSYKSYQNALENLNYYNNPQYHLYGNIYTGLGSVVFKLDRDTALAKEYFNKAEKFIQENKASELELFFVTERRDFYDAVNDIKNYRIYSARKDSLQNIADMERKNLAANFFDEKRTALADSENKLKLIYVFLFGALGLIASYLLIKFFNRKRTYTLSTEDGKKERVENLQNGNNVENSRMIISAETEESILELLNEFEKKKMFLDPEINLTAVAAFCKTNPRYISEILKKHKELDFHKYIIRHRIEYITEKLKEEEYRNYKISYLAKEAGFSSHSRFSANFKEVKGVPPSIYIKRVKKKNKVKTITSE